MKEEMISIEQLMLQDVEKREVLDPQHFYNAKLPSIEMAQEMGLSDDIIEKALNIKIKPEHKKNL